VATRKLAILALLAIGVAVANASVFVFYPITIGAQPASPPLKFYAGSNANQNDLSGTITVSLGDNGTSVDITVHPTYQYTYYHNITVVKNEGSSALYFKINVSNAISGLPTGGKAYLIIRVGTSTHTVDLTQTGAQPSNWIALNSGEKAEVDLEFYIPEGVALPSSISTTVHLVYTNSNSAGSIPSLVP